MSTRIAANLPAIMRSRIPPRSVALVTGSSSGIGLRCCVELARTGLRVVASMRDTSRSQELDAAMAEAGLRCDKISPSFTAFEQLSELIEGYVVPRAADPGMVASVVLSERPGLRYLVGADARAVTMASKLLPFRLWERAVGRIAGFGSASGG